MRRKSKIIIIFNYQLNAAEMDLTDFLRIVFPNKNQEKYTKMIENLEREGFESSSDLKYLDEEVTNNLESFNRIEIKKLKDYFEKNG